MSAEVWVTGVGVATRLGVGRAPLERALREAQAPGSAEVDGPAAVAALEEALEQAGLEPRGRADAALFVGCAWAGLDRSESAVAAQVADKEPDDEAWGRHGSDHLLARLVRGSGLGGLSFVTSAAAAGGADALELGLRWLETSASPTVAVGGVALQSRVAERCLHERLGHDPAGCRPLDPARQGTQAASGAAFLILERAPEAQARGAQPLAALRAVWSARGANALGRVLEQARQSEPDLWLCHGSGGVAEDGEEQAALRAVLEQPIAGLAASKGLLGHTQAAAACLDAAIAVVALDGGFFPCLEPQAELSTISAERLVPRSAVVVARDLLGRAWAVSFARAAAT
ncbi:MAG: beta-ketoacyl synthase N-terminal-like domain-containing protein [Planctomycetota bacterium]